MKPIAQSQRWQREIGDIIFVAILLGAGVGLLSSAIFEMLKSQIAFPILLGVLLIAVGIFFLSKVRPERKSQVERIHGAIAFRVKNETIEPAHIYDYEFNDKFCENLIGFLAENKAYRKRFISYFSPAERKVLHGSERKSAPFFCEIASSVTEFILLDELDLHLNAYLVDHEIDTSTIQRIGRENLSSAVLSNKVIDTFTKHFKDREAFAEDDFDEELGELCYATGKDGAVYNRLSVELPPGASIDRDETGALRVKHPNFELSLLVSFDGSATFVHSDLIQGDYDLDLVPYRLMVKISAKITPPFGSSKKTDIIYDWLDSYLERLDKLLAIDPVEGRLNPEFRRFMKADQQRVMISDDPAEADDAGSGARARREAGQTEDGQ